MSIREAAREVVDFWELYINKSKMSWEDVDPKIQALKTALAEPDQLREALETYLRGCGNAGCYIQRPVGQHTNGPCQCISAGSDRHKLKKLKQALTSQTKGEKE